MMKVLVVYASRHGGTKGIAERIGTVLAGEGMAPTVASAEQDPDPALADACILGSGVYMGSWLKEAVDYGWRHSGQLAERPVWLFSSGPLRSQVVAKAAPSDGPMELALGPAEGPGSGGRRKVTELGDAIHARDHEIFFGAYDPSESPKSMPERLVRMMPAAKNILPPGDFREWDVIEAWAREIARELLRTPVAAG
jgi:menaquinone-dependent protoporphyrinogen oxidase